jgi:hypothetical protein
MVRKTIAALAFLGCAVSALIHLATFFGIDAMTRYRGLWVLHVAAMASCVSVLFSGNVGWRRNGGNLGEAFGAWDAADAKAALMRLDRDEPVGSNAAALLAKRLRPRRVAILVGCLGVYAMVNFVVTLSLLQGGVPEQIGSTYQLVSHGKVLRQLTEPEYRWTRAYQTRLATGHWMFFLVTSAVLWLAPRGALLRRE